MERNWIEEIIESLPTSYLQSAIIISTGIYLIGLILSAITENLGRYIRDFSWISYPIFLVITLALYVPYLKEHRDALDKTMSLLKIEKSETEKIMNKFNKRIGSFKSVPLSLAFSPVFIWVIVNRLWWEQYNVPWIFDIFVGFIFSVLLLFTGSAVWTYCIAFNMNYREMIQLSFKEQELINERFRSLDRIFSTFHLKLTVLFLVGGALINLPLVLLTQTWGALYNVAICVSLAFMVFAIPQYYFHTIIVKIKDNQRKEIVKRLDNLIELGGKDENYEKYLTEKTHYLIYQDVLEKIPEWLFDLRSLTIVIISLLITTTFKVLLSDVIRQFLTLF